MNKTKEGCLLTKLILLLTIISMLGMTSCDGLSEGKVISFIHNVYGFVSGTANNDTTQNGQAVKPKSGGGKISREDAEAQLRKETAIIVEKYKQEEKALLLEQQEQEQKEKEQAMLLIQQEEQRQRDEEQRILLIGKQVVAIVNKIRAERGSGELVWDNTLYQYSIAHSKKMAERHELFHTQVGMAWAENAWGGEGSQSWGAEIIVNSWMNSPKHRTWLLSPNLKRIAVGIAYSNNGMYASWTFWRSETRHSDWWYQYTPNKPPEWWY